ncbi:MAG: ubiquinone-dependent pyruvate dehydrogenase [Verrucomicrobia bacterium]|nr:MAG: ubiquinone-dependent pyruvate dehydrogenase [Verrucomicrobiota bacterium]
MYMNVAELLVKSLIVAGVKHVYGIVGDSLNAFTEALRKQNDIKWIAVRHEEVAAFAAGAEAHLTNSLAVCAGSCGPGNMHLINGLYDCHRSRVPVLAIAAQIPSPELGSNYFQETQPEILFKDCSHYCTAITNVLQAPRVLELAIQTAVSLRGVSVISLSGDIALQPVAAEEPRRAPSISTSRSVLCPAEVDLHRLADLLNRAKNVTILGGAGCAEAHSELMATAEALKAPIVHALRGKEFLEYDNPYDAGMTGLLGFSSGYYAIMDCDTLLMLGTDFPYQQFYPPKASIAQIDLRAENLGRRTRLDLGLVGNVRDTLMALLPLLNKKSDSTHLDKALRHYADNRKSLDALATGTRKPMHPQYLMRIISELAAEDAILTVDVGSPTMWAARYLKMNGRRRLLGSFNHGSMANALPQAIGAQVACPSRQVIALCGDGGFTMLMGDILSVYQHKLPLKIIVFNNSSLGFVELEMKAAGLLDYGTALENPNFAKMAEAIGIRGIRVEDPEMLSDTIRSAFLHNGPVLLDVVVNRLELSLPPKIELAQAKGFTLYMLKAVFSGRGTEILDLAATNLWR